MYADSTIVIGPLATERQPEAYDLCARHVESFTAPRGWQVIRLATSFEPAPPSEDDLTALADEVIVLAHADGQDPQAPATVTDRGRHDELRERNAAYAWSLAQEGLAQEDLSPLAGHDTQEAGS